MQHLAYKKGLKLLIYDVNCAIRSFFVSISYFANASREPSSMSVKAFAHPGNIINPAFQSMCAKQSYLNLYGY